jgi:hypothetical protein
MTDEVCNTVGKRPSFATTSTCHNQQWTQMMINCPSLGVIQARKKAQEENLRSTAGPRQDQFSTIL